MADVFSRFVDSMDALLRETESIDGRDQKTLMDSLFAAEDRFKKTLLSSPDGKQVYVNFMNFILKTDDFGLPQLKEGYIPKTAQAAKKFKQKVDAEGRNMLKAKPYFRERQDTFFKKIGKAFHSRRPEGLHSFKINYEFAKWVMDEYKGKNKKKLADIFSEIKELRQILCHNNLPLAINKAHIFWSKVPESHLEYMDLIQASAEGLITAIDKFVPPYKTVFVSTAIGRMKLNMMQDHNSTMVNLSPKDRRILYRANNAKHKANLSESMEIVDYVNESFKGVTAEELMEIESAATKVANIDEKQEDSYSLSEKIADNSTPVDERILSLDLKGKLMEAMENLSVIEKKVIKLKLGVS